MSNNVVNFADHIGKWKSIFFYSTEESEIDFQANPKSCSVDITQINNAGDSTTIRLTPFAVSSLIESLLKFQKQSSKP